MVIYNNALTIIAGADISTNFSSGLDPKCENIRRNVEIINNPKNHKTIICFVFINLTLFHYLNRWHYCINQSLHFFSKHLILFHCFQYHRTPLIVKSYYLFTSWSLCLTSTYFKVTPRPVSNLGSLFKAFLIGSCY